MNKADEADRYWILFDLFKRMYPDFPEKKLHEFAERRINIEKIQGIEAGASLEKIYNITINSNT